MLCCGECFQDEGLQTEIIPLKSEQTGDCPTCGAIDVNVLQANELRDYFEVLMSIYVPADEGRILVDWLIDDWSLFGIDRANANMLLAEIIDDANRLRVPHAPSRMCETGRLGRWEQLRQELRHGNRFFPDTSLEKDRLHYLLSKLVFAQEDLPERWFRARLQKEERSYRAEEMGPPPKHLATHGRANPAGIPYLYLGSDSVTAVAEVRPHPGEKVSVADFILRDDLKIVDLRNPRASVSPFLEGDEKAMAQLRGDIDYLNSLGSELTTPVLPTSAAIDYIPSQYLCEFIKKSDFDGVVYDSAITDGINVALFDTEAAAVGQVEEFSVISVDVNMEKTE